MQKIVNTKKNRKTKRMQKNIKTIKSEKKVI